MVDLPLTTKYRPSSFDEMIGHTAVIDALKRAIAADSRPHAYLLTGPSGLGKTTLARILAAVFGADVTEIDCASNNGVDTMRDLIELGGHASFGASGKRMFILDECHMLSKPAVNAILKLLEDPPEHLYLALCTTETGKVLETVQTRCYPVQLKPLPAPDLRELLEAIAELEGWKVANDVMQSVIEGSNGSPRMAIRTLQAVHDAPTREEVKRIITLIDAGDPVILLMQHLVSAKGPPSWTQVRGFLERMESIDYESMQIAAGAYLAKVLVNTKEPDRAERIWKMMDALIFPSQTFDKRVAFITALGRILWG